MFDGIMKIYEGTSEVMGSVNPFVTSMKDGRNEEILTLLVQSGYKKEEIMDFIDVSASEAEEELENLFLKERIRQELMLELKPKAKKRTARTTRTRG